MAKRAGNGLAEAVRDLTRAQAIAQLQIAESERRFRAEIAESERLYKREMVKFHEIVAAIFQKLDALPDLVKEKIGFVPPGRRAR